MQKPLRLEGRPLRQPREYPASLPEAVPVPLRTLRLPLFGLKNTLAGRTETPGDPLL
jgi:hypothetical protein